MSWPNALEYAHTTTAANKSTALLVAWVCSSCDYYIAWYLTVLIKDWCVNATHSVNIWECSVTYTKVCYRMWHSVILGSHIVSVLYNFHTAIWNMPVKHSFRNLWLDTINPQLPSSTLLDHVRESLSKVTLVLLRVSSTQQWWGEGRPPQQSGLQSKACLLSAALLLSHF